MQAESERVPINTDGALGPMVTHHSGPLTGRPHRRDQTERTEPQRVQSKRKDQLTMITALHGPTAPLPHLVGHSPKAARGRNLKQVHTVIPWCPRGVSARTHLGYQNPSMLMSLILRARTVHPHLHPSRQKSHNNL